MTIKFQPDRHVVHWGSFIWGWAQSRIVTLFEVLWRPCWVWKGSTRCPWVPDVIEFCATFWRLTPKLTQDSFAILSSFFFRLRTCHRLPWLILVARNLVYIFHIIRILDRYPHDSGQQLQQLLPIIHGPVQIYDVHSRHLPRAERALPRLSGMGVWNRQF